MLQLNLKAADTRVKVFPGEPAKTLETKINDWLKEMSRSGDVCVHGIDLEDAGRGFYSAIAIYSVSPSPAAPPCPSPAPTHNC